jgi:hypothetical protein
MHFEETVCKILKEYRELIDTYYFEMSYGPSGCSGAGIDKLD